MESLKHNGERTEQLDNLEGLWADLNIRISEEGISQTRRELWGNFPRDIKL